MSMFALDAEILQIYCAQHDNGCVEDAAHQNHRDRLGGPREGPLVIELQASCEGEGSMLVRKEL